MSDVQMLKSSVSHRLTVSAEEEIIIFKEEKDRQEKLLDSVFNPELHRADFHQLKLEQAEVLPEQQERSSNLKQENPAEAAHIKEEQEEVWISQEREQLQEPEEDDIIRFPFFPGTVKSEEGEEEEEKALEEIRDTEHFKTEADRQDCEGSEPDRDFNPHSHLQTVSPDETSHLSGSDTDDSADWEESDEPQEGSNPLQNRDGAVSDLECSTGDPSLSSSECVPIVGQKKQQEHKANGTGENSFSCSVCDKIYPSKISLQQHMYRHPEEKRFSCSFCEKSFIKRSEMMRHMRVHTGERPFSCSICGKSFTQSGILQRHMTVHSGERPLSCSVCGKRFPLSGDLKRHAIVHSGEKPFTCSVCGKSFSRSGNLKQHTFVHTRERPFGCSVCGKRFTLNGDLKRHSVVHTGERPFSCTVCGKRFTQNENLKKHMVVHTGEKPFSCNVCGKRFSQLGNVKQHKCVGKSRGNSK